MEGHTDWIWAVAVTPDGQHIVSGSSDRTVRVWDLASGRLEHTLEGHTHRVVAVTVTPDSQHIISAGEFTVRVWNLADGRPEHTLKSPEWVVAVAVTPDGRHIISASDTTLRVWNLTDGTELTRWDADATITCCASDPIEPATLVYADSDGRVVALSLCEPHPARIIPTQ